MKRKLLLVLLTVMLTAVCAIGFSACGTETHTHSLTHHPAAAATCTEEGNIEYWSCSGCGKYFADEDGDEKISTVVIAAAGHTYSEKWSSDGTYHWHAATCGHNEVSDRAEHVWGTGEVTEEPTCTETGERLFTCEICNAAKRMDRR